jgi:signal transduction histidine kinase
MLMPIVSGASLLEQEIAECYAGLPEADAAKLRASRELVQEVIDMIRRGATRIQARLKEIGASVKGLSNPPHFAPCRISDIVASVYQAPRIPAQEQDVVLRTEGLEALPEIQADEARLFNALYNLVNNAIPEVPPGGSVTVGGRSRASEIELWVADTGRGMPPEVRDSLFTYRAVSSKPGGTGLGTKIVKDVVDAHGGTIAVMSAPGAGTTFRIALPIQGPAQAPAASAATLTGDRS